MKSVLYRTLVRVITNAKKTGDTEGLEEKLDIFFAAGKLTEAEYQELMALLKNDSAEGDSSVKE